MSPSSWAVMAALAYALFFHAWDALNVAGNVAK
jgi:hypothetical protein